MPCGNAVIAAHMENLMDSTLNRVKHFRAPIQCCPQVYHNRLEKSKSDIIPRPRYKEYRLSK
jgi:hypothetical protein